MVELWGFSYFLAFVWAEGANERVDEEDGVYDDEEDPEAKLEAEKARKVLFVKLGVAVTMKLVAANAATAYQHRGR